MDVNSLKRNVARLSNVDKLLALQHPGEDTFFAYAFSEYSKRRAPGEKVNPAILFSLLKVTTDLPFQSKIIQATIKSTYRAVARQCHPDKLGVFPELRESTLAMVKAMGGTEITSDTLTQLIKVINSAHGVLGKLTEAEIVSAYMTYVACQTSV